MVNDYYKNFIEYFKQFFPTDFDFSENYTLVSRGGLPKKGQTLAKFAAMAEFIDGGEKRQIIDLAKQYNTARSSQAIMQKLCFSCEKDSTRIPREIAEDLVSGMTEDEVAEKSYIYQIELFFYTYPEFIPENEHWLEVKIHNLEKFLEQIEEENFSENS